MLQGEEIVLLLWVSDSHGGKLTHCYGLVIHMKQAVPLLWSVILMKTIADYYGLGIFI